jgi:biotin transport system substrate-specific component
LSTKGFVYAALFAALIAVLGMLPPISVGFIPVPITAQTLGVMLAGAFLGKRIGAISLLIFIVLVALGLPLLSGGRGGLSALVGPSAGYIFSWPIAAFCIGYFAEKVWSSLKVWKLILINFVFGVMLVSLIGAPIMALITNTSVVAALIGALVYLPGDLLKAIITSVIVVQIKQISPIEQKILRAS